MNVSELSDKEYDKHINQIISVLKSTGILLPDMVEKWKQNKKNNKEISDAKLSKDKKIDKIKNELKCDYDNLIRIITTPEYLNMPYHTKTYFGIDGIIDFKTIYNNWIFFFGILCIRYITTNFPSIMKNDIDKTIRLFYSLASMKEKC